ncbi:MAG: fungal-specific transcription factor domain-containing protein [Podila humilis]|nr:MAG: fungal-specific transcription factor domain-containing protein [Podila humilis]
MDIGLSIRQKRLKAGTACTNCRRKKLRCTGTPNCVRCVTHKLDCVVDEALFLKTNSPQSLYAKTNGSRPPHILASNSSSLSSILASHPSHHIQRHQQQHQQQHYRPRTPDHSNNNFHHPYGYQHHDRQHSSLSSASSCSDDLMERRLSMDFSPERRMSASSRSSASPDPSPGTYSNHYSNPFAPSPSSPSNSTNTVRQSVILSDPPSSSKIKKQQSTDKPTPSSHVYSGVALDPFSNTPHVSSSTSTSVGASSKKRLSKDHDSIKPKQKRKNSKQDSDVRPTQEIDGNSTSPQPGPVEGSTDKKIKDKEEYKSVVSTMSLDGHGQHFHGSSSGFYVVQLSTRFRQGVYPLPMAHLNDSDLWSHSLQITSERELPPKEEMDKLLDMYFRYMYPFAPMFIRRSFMEQHYAQRPDLSQILILNAIFCNACWYSDDPAIKQESTKYFNRAKIILDETYHVSRISTIQALLLMSKHQYGVGNYSGGWLYTGMATRIAHDIGLHRQDVQAIEPEEGEIRRRVWWAVYISDRLGGGILGRPVVIRDKEYNVQMPSDEWITEIGDDDMVEYPYEPERIVSCRLLWSVKLFMQMGNVLNTMHCIEAEINGNFLAEISKTQLPQLHNSLTSWFLGLPNELMYTPYTMSPNSNVPPSPQTALMHMFYYTALTMLHRPYLRPVNSDSIDSNFLASSRNICTAAATNVCHIADSLMLHGQLRDTCYYGMGCLLAAGTVHIHNAITPTPSNRETTRAGLSKTVKAAHELVRTFPVAESLVAVALDVFASQTTSVPTEMAATFIDISTFVAPFMDMTQLQSTSISNIYEAARLAKFAKNGLGPAPSIQLRHPYGNFSMPLPEQEQNQCSTNLSNLWQNHIATAVAMAAIAFGGTDPQQQELQFFANPLELPEALRLAPIDTIAFQMESLGTGGTSTGLDSFGDAMMGLQGNRTFNLVPPQQSTLLQYQQQMLSQPSQQQTTTDAMMQTTMGYSSNTSYSVSSDQLAPSAAQNQNLIKELSSSLSASLHMKQSTPIITAQPIVPSQSSCVIIQYSQSSPQQQTQQLQQQLQNIMMEDDTADPPSPPAVSSDDMDMESSCLSDDTDPPGEASRHNVQTQCDSTDEFISSLTKGVASSVTRTEDVDKVSTLLFDGPAMEC